MEVDLALVITNLLIRLITGAENSANNIQTLAKKNLCPVLFQNLQAIYSENLSGPNAVESLAPSNKVDEVFTNIFTLFSKMSKYGFILYLTNSEPKLALLARLHNATSISWKLVKRAYEKRDFGQLVAICGVLKIFIAKNGSLNESLRCIRKQLDRPPEEQCNPSFGPNTENIQSANVRWKNGFRYRIDFTSCQIQIECPRRFANIWDQVFSLKLQCSIRGSTKGFTQGYSNFERIWYDD